MPAYLSIEKIAEYLGIAPAKVRIALRRLAKGRYVIELEPGVWVGVEYLMELELKTTPRSAPKLKPSSKPVDIQKLMEAPPAGGGRIQ